MGFARGALASATWGDIPRHTPGRAGHTMAHSSTAKGRGCTQECLRSTKHSVQPGVSARRRGLLLPE
jgi:hypothetical protein